jgi:copper(I)-binding protein
MNAFATPARTARVLVFLVGITIFLLVSAASGGRALSDELTETVGGILVEDAVITPVKAGGTAHLQFKVTNFGSNSVNLRAVRSNVARVGRMTMLQPDSKPEIVSSFLILSEETLNLSTSHVRVELRDVKQAIEKGSSVEFDLIFRKFKMSASAHAH